MNIFKMPSRPKEKNQHPNHHTQRPNPLNHLPKIQTPPPIPQRTFYRLMGLPFIKTTN
jgi:hypothetical protein